MNKLVRKYQCPGCSFGASDECYEKMPNTITCENHVVGTRSHDLMGIVKVMLGLPNGFNQTGNNENPIFIFEKWDDCEWFGDTIYNIPDWYHVNKAGHTLIRVYQPRKNLGFTLVFGEDVSRKLPWSCRVITQEMIDKMD